MHANDIPGAPEWVRDLLDRVDSKMNAAAEREELLVERFRGVVRAEVAPVLAQLGLGIKQIEGYGQVVSHGVTQVNHAVALVAQMESRLARIEEVSSAHAVRPTAKAAAAPATSPSGGPQLRAVAAIAGKVDNSSTIPAPPGDEDAS